MKNTLHPSPPPPHQSCPLAVIKGQYNNCWRNEAEHHHLHANHVIHNPFTPQLQRYEQTVSRDSGNIKGVGFIEVVSKGWRQTRDTIAKESNVLF
jgi:hypothetical protein